MRPVYYCYLHGYLFFCSGYLHAHISYLDDSCQTCLLLLAVDKDLFFKLSECRDKIKEVSSQCY